MNYIKMEMMWQLFNKKQKSGDSIKGNRQDRLARWIADKIIRTRSCIVKCLEQADKRMTQRWRKIIFYVSILVGNACLLYILGNALRKTQLPHVPPLYDQSEIKQRIKIDPIINNINDSNAIFQQHKKSDNGKN